VVSQVRFFMVNQGYTRSTSDHCMYVKKFNNDDFIILLLYIDDMLIVRRDKSKIEKLKKELSKYFDMKDLGLTTQILGMKISRDRKTRYLWVSQGGYIQKVLERFNMHQTKPVDSPLANHFRSSSKQCPSIEKEKKVMMAVPCASAIGSLIYAIICMRPDIAHAVDVVSRFLANLEKNTGQQ